MTEDIIQNTEEELTEDENGQLYEHLRIVVDKGQVPLRIDKFMTEKLQHTSRNRIQRAADSGFVHVNEKPVKSNYKVRPLDVITLMLDRPQYDSSIEPEDIPLDIVYEDSELMIINKPAGMVVHPGCGNYHGTLVNAVAWHLKDVPDYDPNDPEVGLVHRIDKDTSGLLVVAKTPLAKTKLGVQFFNKTTHRSYNACMGKLPGRRGTHRRKYRTGSERPAPYGSLSAGFGNRENGSYPLSCAGTFRLCDACGVYT